jgi:glucan phosphoethanolaminetransferase (alkaline phosphatase superfamily)
MSPALAFSTRLSAAGCLAASGFIHAELYLHGYRVIPGVGSAFLLQAGGAVAVALLLLLTASVVPRLIAAGLAFGALAGFAASRTVGIFGFVERGLEPAPQALISLLVEVATLALLVVGVSGGPAVHRSRLESVES